MNRNPFFDKTRKSQTIKIKTAFENLHNGGKEAKDFVLKCLQKDQDDRSTARELLDHPWIRYHMDHRQNFMMIQDILKSKECSTLPQDFSKLFYEHFNKKANFFSIP